MKGTISDWERNRFDREVKADLHALPVVEEPATRGELAVASERPADGWIALMGRFSSGLGVQLLWHPVTEDVAVTLVDGTRTTTFAVAHEDAWDAFHHPYVYAP